MSAARIPVIEDNPADVDLLRRALVDAGVNHDLTVIEDGGAALAYIRRCAGPPFPDLIILDVHLPKHSGVEILDEMQGSILRTVPVLIFTSSSSRRDHERMDKRQVCRYLTKPPELAGYLRIGLAVRELLFEKRARPLAEPAC